MSASTLSITANPTTRRRPVLVGDKRTSIELVDDAVPAFSGGRDDRVSNGKDPSHSIRGEAVLERSRDAVQVKKPLSAGAAALQYSRRNARKAVVKPEKPRWLTVMSVFTKNLLLFIVLMGLLQMIWKLVALRGNGFPITTGTEFERRIADVEGLLKKTTKMMQLQVEVVDNKIELGLRDLRKDLDQKIEDKHMELANEIKKFDGRTEGLERSLADLSSGDWINREDFDRFLDELKKSKGIDDSGDVDLDKIRAIAREIVEKELEKHAADGLGRVDYALASGGAMVVKHSGSGWFLRMNRNGVHKDAVKMLSPSFGEPGQCFPLKGNSGFVQIRLRTAIIPEAVTLEHVAKCVAYDRSSAPKDCRVSGWLQNHDTTGQVVDTGKMYLLAEFTYDLEKSSAQTFSVLGATDSGIIDTIRLDFTSNHGSPSHTCIYRLRVHGLEPNSISMLAAQS